MNLIEQVWNFMKHDISFRTSEIINNKILKNYHLAQKILKESIFMTDFIITFCIGLIKEIKILV